VVAAEAEKDARDQLLREAREAHAKFIDAYHQLNLEIDPRMWVEVRVVARGVWLGVCGFST
jgi:hypothetical protein